MTTERKTKHMKVQLDVMKEITEVFLSQERKYQKITDRLDDLATSIKGMSNSSEIQDVARYLYKVGDELDYERYRLGKAAYVLEDVRLEYEKSENDITDRAETDYSSIDTSSHNVNVGVWNLSQNQLYSDMANAIGL